MAWLPVFLPGFGAISADSATFTGAVTVGTLNGVTILTGAADPSAGAGVAATRPAIYFRTGTDQIWEKNGAGDTAWTRVFTAVDGALKADLASPTFTGTVGAAAITATGRIITTADGAAATPAVTVGSSGTMGLYQSAANTLALSGNSTALATFHTGGISFFNAATRVQNGFVTSGVISPAALTADVTDYNPFPSSNIHLSAEMRLVANADANRTINSMLAGQAGQRMRVWNIDTAAARTKTLLHDDGATGTAAQRFLCPGAANVVITVGSCVDLWYDTTSSRWRVQKGF